MNQFIRNQINASIEVKQSILGDAVLIGVVEALSRRAVLALQGNNKLLVAGNGGSAADAQHIAGELVSRFYFDRPALPAVALTTDTSILTAIGNDYGYEQVFSRQVEALGREGDVFLGISTSGTSPNILRALRTARDKRLVTAGLCGAMTEKMAPLCDFLISVPSRETPRIQESHILIGHVLCAAIEEAVFGKGFAR